ncbi:MAG: disulfide bond formation protein B [Leptothrix ochracea]
MAMTSAAVVAAALVGQHRFDMQPCPWCILQRLIYVVIAIVAVIGITLPSKGAGRRVVLMLISLFSAAGACAALYQNRVAVNLASCDMTLADRIISGLGVDALLPDVFEVRASCAEAAVRLLGVPFELWSLALYVSLGVAAVSVVLGMTGSGRGKRT